MHTQYITSWYITAQHISRFRTAPGLSVPWAVVEMVIPYPFIIHPRWFRKGKHKAGTIRHGQHRCKTFFAEDCWIWLVDVYIAMSGSAEVLIVSLSVVETVGEVISQSISASQMRLGQSWVVGIRAWHSIFTEFPTGTFPHKPTHSMVGSFLRGVKCLIMPIYSAHLMKFPLHHGAPRGTTKSKCI